MPIYEYQCRVCHRKMSALVLIRAHEVDVRCAHCGSADIERLWSRFSSPKSEEARMESLADPSALAGLDENDPQSVARFMKKMGREMGEDVGGDIEQAMEEEMGGGGGGGDAGGGDPPTGFD
ncbi:MAG: zinc ribbon domain-containing protein [Acidobacteria bacterium]|nr:zinc ribbon domain-containing protein [Acidobacteriota bacterium]